VKSLLFLVTVTSAALAAAPARAESSPSPEQPEIPGVDRREGNWRVEAGYRGSFISQSGYQAFSNNGYLPEFALTASHTMFRHRPFSLALGLGWDVGGSGASLRQVDHTSLGMNRFTVTLEGRLHFGPWGYAFVRAAPGVAVLDAEVDDAGSPAPLKNEAWVSAGDIGAGYAWLVGPRSEGSKLEPRFWLQCEGGYGWVAGEELALQPALASNSPIRTTGVDLGSLAMQGGFFRIAVAVTF
jgi:hypothetical protein